MLRLHGSSLVWKRSYPRTLARVLGLSIVISSSGLQKAEFVIAASDDPGENKIHLLTKVFGKQCGLFFKFTVWRLDLILWNNFHKCQGSCFLALSNERSIAEIHSHFEKNQVSKLTWTDFISRSRTKNFSVGRFFILVQNDAGHSGT